jgi:hypothetical protein
MTRSRLTALAAMFLFLSGCAGAYTPGIVDSWVPPQAEPVTSQQPDPAVCREVLTGPSDEPLRAEDVVPCAPQILAAVTDPGRDVTHPRGRQGVTPPTMGRR